MHLQEIALAKMTVTILSATCISILHPRLRPVPTKVEAHRLNCSSPNAPPLSLPGHLHFSADQCRPAGLPSERIPGLLVLQEEPSYSGLSRTNLPWSMTSAESKHINHLSSIHPVARSDPC